MILANSWRKPNLTFRPGRTSVVATASGNVSQSTKTIFMEFTPVYPGYLTTAIPTRFGCDGRLPCHLDTEQEAVRISRLLVAKGLDPVTNDDLVEWIRAHPQFGVSMIFVDESNTEVVGDEGYGDGITAVGDGSYQCVSCDNRVFPSKQGLHLHVKSAAHVANLAAARETQLEIA